MNQAKSLLQSKTFWLAVLQAALGAVVVFQTAYPAAGWLMVLKSLLDIALRVQTTQPVNLE